MSATHAQANRLKRLLLGFPIPQDSVFQVEITEREWRTLLLAALDAAAKSDSEGFAGSPTAKAITGTASVVAPASLTGRMVSIFNNGTNDVIILEGGTPIAANGSSPTYDFGTVIHSGGYWESTIISTTAISAVCRASKSSVITVTIYS